MKTSNGEPKEGLSRLTDCELCSTQDSPENIADAYWPINASGDVGFKIDGSPLAAGHILAVTKAHLTSFAQLSPSELTEVDARLTEHEGELAEIFGDYFRLEHGSDNVRSYGGSGGCIDHAHIHLVPAEEDVGPVLQDQLPWQRLDSLKDLAWFRNRPYIYLGRLAAHYVVPEPKLAGQWVRRQTAAIRGIDVWDWALSKNDSKVLETMSRIGETGLGVFQAKT